MSPSKSIKPVRIAHRVTTLVDLQAAISSDIEGVEIDIRMTRDGVLIVKHSRRYTNAYGRKSWVDKVPYDEIHESSTRPVTTLESIFEHIISSKRSNLILDLDIKQYHIHRQVVDLIQKYKMFTRSREIIISSPDVRVLEAFNRLSERFQLSLTFAPNDRLDLTSVRLFKYLILIGQYTMAPIIYRLLRRKSRHKEIQYANVHYRMIDANLVNFLHDHDIKVLAFHATAQRHIAQLEKLGVDGIKIKV